MLAVVESMDVALFGISIIVIFLALFGVFLFSVWFSRMEGSVSPYSRQPMRRGEDLSYDSKLKLLRFLYEMHQYDNRIFEIKRSAVCRQTGRVFPNAMTWYGLVKLDWTFLQKRHPGNYVSWGSLTQDQQEIIIESHESLKGFQTEFSSPTPQPRAVEAKYAFTSPGPLYVDINTNTLVGWMNVPRSELEVLIVQKPTNIISPGMGVS